MHIAEYGGPLEKDAVKRYYQEAERGGPNSSAVRPGMEDRGVTLTELLIVVAIIGILVLALGFSFQGWIGRYKIESETKEMYVELMNARARAMQRNRVHLLDFPNATSYRISEDFNNNGAVDAGEPLPTYPKTVRHALNSGGGLAIITFNTRGILSPEDTIWITLPAGITPDYDCIVALSTRINMGQMSGGTCVVK